MVVKNPFGLFILLFSAFSVIYKSYRQVLTPVKNLQRLLRLPIFDMTQTGFYQLEKTRVLNDLDLLHAVVKTFVTKRSPKSDDAKLLHFDAAM